VKLFLGHHQKRNQEVMQLIRDARDAGNIRGAIQALEARVGEIEVAIREVPQRFRRHRHDQVLGPLRQELSWAKNSLIDLEFELN